MRACVHACVRVYMLTTLEDVYETHQQRAQLLAVEGVLLLRHVYLDLSAGDVLQQHPHQLEQEPTGEEEEKREEREIDMESWLYMV